MLALQLGVRVLGVDVVAYPDEFGVVVGTGEEDDGYADQVGRGNAGWERSGSLREGVDVSKFASLRPTRQSLLILASAKRGRGSERQQLEEGRPTSNSKLLTPTGTGPTMHVSSSWSNESLSALPTYVSFHSRSARVKAREHQLAKQVGRE